jgi:hypothetical protein
MQKIQYRGKYYNKILTVYHNLSYHNFLVQGAKKLTSLVNVIAY